MTGKPISLAAAALMALSLAGCGQQPVSANGRTGDAGGASQGSPDDARTLVGRTGQVAEQPAPPANFGDGPRVTDIGRLLVLGDSYSRDENFREALQAELPDLEIVWDSVGGSSLEDQLFRLEERYDTEGWPIVILDGGLTDPQPLGLVEAIVDLQQAECGLWFYVEPVRRAFPNKRMQERRLGAAARFLDTMEQDYTGHTIFWNDALIASSDGTAQDALDTDQGLVPQSLRRDAVHLNRRGATMLAAIIAERLRTTRGETGCE